MKLSMRKAAAIVGIILLVCAVVALIKSTSSSADGNRIGKEATGRPADVANAEGRPDKSADEAVTSPEGELIGRTKVRERPVETALDKKRRERQRLVEDLARCKAGGLGERHPTVVKITGDIKRVEEELTAAGDSATPSN
jgi:hypothetical protein